MTPVVRVTDRVTGRACWAAEAVALGVTFVAFNGESLSQWGARAALSATESGVTA